MALDRSNAGRPLPIPNAIRAIAADMRAKSQSPTTADQLLKAGQLEDLASQLDGAGATAPTVTGQPVISTSTPQG